MDLPVRLAVVITVVSLPSACKVSSSGGRRVTQRWKKVDLLRPSVSKLALLFAELLETFLSMKQPLPNRGLNPTETTQDGLRCDTVWT